MGLTPLEKLYGTTPDMTPMECNARVLEYYRERNIPVKKVSRQLDVMHIVKTKKLDFVVIPTDDDFDSVLVQMSGIDGETVFDQIKQVCDALSVSLMDVSFNGGKTAGVNDGSVWAIIEF